MNPRRMNPPHEPAPDGAAAYALDISRVRRSFDRAAATYDAAAVLHADVRDNLLARLDLMALAPRVVLDAGAGTGHASRALKTRYPKALVIALDSSPRMLQAAGRSAILAAPLCPRLRRRRAFTPGGRQR